MCRKKYHYVCFLGIIYKKLCIAWGVANRRCGQCGKVGQLVCSSPNFRKWALRRVTVEELNQTYNRCNERGHLDLDCDLSFTTHKSAERGPILSSLFYASIPSQDCLEQALAFALANRFQKPTFLATQLMDIFSTVMKHDKGIQHSIRLDI